VYLWKSVGVKWFAVVRCQFMFQVNGKDGFMFDRKFPDIGLNLRLGNLTQNIVNL
jgi:hypothetical protein